MGLHKQSLGNRARKLQALRRWLGYTTVRFRIGSWRNKSVVTPPKDQADGDCWAFSAIVKSHVRVEYWKIAYWHRRAHKLRLQPTEMWRHRGCEGGIQDIGFNYAKANGLALEKLPV